MDAKRSGGGLASRPLHFFWIIDCSGSMGGEKIEALNYAIRNALPEMQKAAASNPNAQVLVRAIRFSDSAQWHIAQPTAVENFSWTDLKADGTASMGKALSLLAEQLKTPPMPEHAMPPVLVLLSDGQPTDDFNGGLKALMEEPWGKKSVRIAIAIGHDADEGVLQRFIGHPEFRPLKANNSDDLVEFIKWASSVVVKTASSPANQPAGGGPTLGPDK